MSRNDIIVRISGKGQFKINSEILDKINKIDNSIVDLIENYSSGTSDHKTTQKDLQNKLTEMVSLITSNVQPLDHKEIVQSETIIPDSDLSIEEATKIFKGEGVISTP
jgi:archaellum component FlaC